MVSSYVLTKDFVACVLVHFFFTTNHFCLAGFSLLTASISHFLTADIKFSCCFSNKIRLLCLLSLGLSVQTVKLSRKKLGIVVVFSP